MLSGCAVGLWLWCGGGAVSLKGGRDESNPCRVYRRAVSNAFFKGAVFFGEGDFFRDSPVSDVVAETRAVGLDFGDGHAPLNYFDCFFVNYFCGVRMNHLGYVAVGFGVGIVAAARVSAVDAGQFVASDFFGVTVCFVALLGFLYIIQRSGNDAVNVRLTGWLVGQVRGGFAFWRGDFKGRNKQGAFCVGQRVRYAFKYFIRGIKRQQLSGADGYAGTQAAALAGLVQGLPRNAKGVGTGGSAGVSGVECGKNALHGNSKVRAARWRLVVTRRGMWCQARLPLEQFLDAGPAKGQSNLFMPSF